MTQKQIALKVLRRTGSRGASVTQLRNAGIKSPSGVICHLRDEGRNIETYAPTRSNAKHRYVIVG